MNRVTACVFVCLLFSCRCCQAAEPFFFDADRVQQDVRLNAHISIDVSPIFLGELVHRLSRQAGVSLQMDERDPASGIQVSAVLHNVPLSEALNGIWSLVSFQNALWHWDREGKTGAYQYRLVQTRESKELAARLRKEIQTAFQAHAELMVKLARMPQEERIKHLDELAASMWLENKKVIASWMNPEPAYEDTWTAMRVFGDALTTAQHQQAIDGSSVDIPFDKLSTEGQTFALMHMRQIGGIDEELKKTFHPSLRFVTKWSGEWVAPTFFIEYELPLDATIRRFDGDTFASLWSPTVEARIEARWQLPGDAAHTDAEKHTNAQPDKPEPEPKLIPGRIPAAGMRVLPDRLHQMASVAPLSFLACLTAPPHVDPGNPYDQTTGAYLDLLRKNSKLMHKWRGNVLLVNFPAWFEQGEPAVSYALVKKIRSLRQTPDGFPPLRALAEIIGTLTDTQVAQIAAAFPELANTVQQNSLLRLYRQYPQMAGDAGIAWNEEAAAALPGLFVGYMDPLEAQYVRVKQSDRQVKNETLRLTIVEVQDKQRVWHPIAAYFMRSPPPTDKKH